MGARVLAWADATVVASKIIPPMIKSFARIENAPFSSASSSQHATATQAGVSRDLFSNPRCGRGQKRHPRVQYRSTPMAHIWTQYCCVQRSRRLRQRQYGVSACFTLCAPHGRSLSPGNVWYPQEKAEDGGSFRSGSNLRCGGGGD